MPNTETPVPDLSIMATISRAELVAIVRSLGLDPDRVLALRLDPEGIFIHEIPKADEDGYRIIGVRG